MPSIGRRAMVLGWLLSTGLGLGCDHRAERQPRLSMAILPQDSLHLMSQRYHPLLMHLEQQTGRRVEWVSASTWEGFAAVVERRRPHFAWQDGYLTLLLVKTQSAQPFLQVRSAAGSPLERGLVVVRTDSRVRNLQDLRGRRVAVPSRQAWLSGLAQAALCAREGIDPAEEIACLVARRTDRALLWVLAGKADAAFVRAGALAMLPRDLGRDSLRVVAETGPLPGDALVAFPHTPPDLIRETRAALTALDPEDPRHADLLRQAGIGGFAPVHEPSSSMVRRLLRDLMWPL